MIHYRDELPQNQKSTEETNAIWAQLAQMPRRKQLRVCRKRQGIYAYDNWRFLAKTRLLPCDCVIWLGMLSGSGYGVFELQGDRYQAHRVSYIWERGDIPYGYFIDHLCANKRCVASYHLEAVTPRENTKRSNLPLAKAPACRYSHAVHYARRLCAECGDRIPKRSRDRV